MNAHLESAFHWLQELGPYTGPVVFACLLTVWNTVCLPCTLLEIAAGAVFPWEAALVAVMTGKAAAASISFLVARRLSHWAPASVKASTTIQRIHATMASSPFLACTVIGFAPIPVAAKNYGLGLVPESVLSFSTFLSVRLLTGLPYSCTWVRLGASIGDLHQAINGDAPVPYSTMAACSAVLVGCWTMSRRAGRFLDDPAPEKVQDVGGGPDVAQPEMSLVVATNLFKIRLKSRGSSLSR